MRFDESEPVVTAAATLILAAFGPGRIQMLTAGTAFASSDRIFQGFLIAEFDGFLCCWHCLLFPRFGLLSVLFSLGQKH